MAEKGFDFGALKALKLPQYEKEYCKANEVKKCGAAVIFLDYKLAGKKTPCVVIPFKKYSEAAQAFKDVKLNKEHLMKKSALAELTIVKGAGGKDEITVDLKKGGISPDALKLKGEDLFVNTIGMALKIVGGAEAAEYANEPEGEEDEADETNAKPNEKNLSKENATQKDTQKDAKKDAAKQDRAAKIDLMQDNVDKMNKAVGTTPKEKLEPNIKKYEDALAQLTKAAQADGKIDKDEQAKIDALKTALEELRNSMDNAGEVKGKKLTDEQKVKIKENMTKINARLDAIVKNLGL